MRDEPYFAAAFGTCALLGAYKIASSTLGLMGTFSRHVLRSPYNHHQRYSKPGADSWAVVTGGSDGIGLEICHQMAAQGFNIVIIARNPTKIEQKLAELKAKYPKIKTRGVTFDFSKLVKISDYKEKIGDALKDIDIAMLFLNAGFIRVGPFQGITNQAVENDVTCNALQPIYTMKVLVDQMVARDHIAAMVITTSGLGSIALPGCTTYSASKSFSTFLGQGLAYELKGKVDCMAW